MHRHTVTLRPYIYDGSQVTYDDSHVVVRVAQHHDAAGNGDERILLLQIVHQRINLIAQTQRPVRIGGRPAAPAGEQDARVQRRGQPRQLIEMPPAKGQHAAADAPKPPPESHALCLACCMYIDNEIND